MTIAKKIETIIEKSSWIRKMFEEGAQLKAQHGAENVFDFSLGNPNVPPPEKFSKVLKETVDADGPRDHCYMPNTGYPQVCQSIADYLSGEQQVEVSQQEVIMTVGAAGALNVTLKAILDPGDEVLTPAPCFVEYGFYTDNHGGMLKTVPTHPDFTLDIDAIAEAINAKTKALLINSPNNPTGAVYPVEDLSKISRLALKHQLFIVADEAYSPYVYDGMTSGTMFDFEDVRCQLIVARSFSKGYNMTGFRIGYIAAAEEIIRAINKLQSHLSGNVCTFAQYGALAALEMTDKDLAAWRFDLEKKRDYAYAKVSEWFACVKPQGAFYLFPDISRYLDGRLTSADFAERLLKDFGVAVVAGEEFGMPGCIRISYAVSEEDLVNGLDRIEEAL